MGPFILILIISTGQLQMQEWSSVQQCMAARDSIVSAYAHSIGSVIYSECKAK